MTEDQLLRRSIEHLHGPEEIPYGEDEIVVVCLVRDGRPYVKSFVEHYLSLGVKHLIFLDNNSTDGTAEALKKYDRVTVLGTKLPYKEYKYLMKQYLITRFGKKDSWSLYVDIDELFDYPYSDAVGLDSLLGYLNGKSYTAVAAQMLDMFPEKPVLNAVAAGEDEPLKERHRFYDLSNLGRRSMKGLPRFRGNMLENDEVEWFNGGIRDTLFGVRPHLTKFPLMFLDDRIKPFGDSSHWVDNARIADFTCVLFHYKFLEHFHEQVARAVREENYWADSAQYKKYLEVLESDPSLQVKQETSKELEGVNDLLENRFLVVSEDYVSWVNAEEEKSSLRPPWSEPRGLAEAFLEARQQERAKTLEMQRLGRRLLDRESLIHSLQQRLEKIEASQVRERQRAQRQKLQRARRQIRSLEQRLERLETSRTLRLIKALHRIKARVLALGRRSSSRTQDGGRGSSEPD
ncbi:MAG: glycosyltransferase family 2 protein [Rubrobacter sp.]|nr:glycosyltransferase family 2 protein [Rubrobacter sp.]